jgi:hypothetical protein
MAKKRRRSHNRSHPGPATRGAVRTADPIAETEDDGDGGGARRRGGAPAVRAAGSRPATTQRTRTEKKELARRQREEIRKRVRRAELRRRLLWAGGVAAVLAVASYLILRPDEPATRPDRLPGELRTEAPWGANGDQTLERADLIGLPGEGTALHEHANVQVFVHGERVSVPQGVGQASASDFASLHTHTGDGLVHIESADVGHTFTLGEFFDVWGVRLSGQCIGGYCVSGDDELLVFKDGNRVTGSPRGVVLDEQSVIVLTFGTPAEVPSPLPTFDFSTIQA